MSFDIASDTRSALGGRSRNSAVIAISRSVTIAVALLSSSMTGSDPQSQSHIILSASEAVSPDRMVTTCLVINSLTVMRLLLHLVIRRRQGGSRALSCKGSPAQG